MTFETLIDDGMAALDRAEFDAAAALFRQAESIASGEADRALAAMRLAAIDVLRTRPDADLRVFRENVMRRHSPMHLFVAAYYLTVAAVDRGDRDSATRYLPVLLEAAHELEDPTWRIRAYNVAAGAESIRGNHVAAIEYGRVALEAFAQRAERRRPAGWQGGVPPPASRERDAPGPAGEDAGAPPNGRGDDEINRAFVVHNHVYNCLAASEYGEAMRYADEAVERAEATGNRPLIRQALVTAAFAYLCRDRLDEALGTIDRAEPMIGATYLEKYLHYLRGEIARRRGDRDEAARHFKRLEALYPGMPTLTEMLLSMNLAPFLLPE